MLAVVRNQKRRPVYRHRFQPEHGLPVVIDYTERDNPLRIGRPVLYRNGIVTVPLPKDFKWDGASIPSWVPLLPWLATLVAERFYTGPVLAMLITFALLYSVRLLPYMQKMGRHVRAAAIHDWLYREQVCSRATADSIMEDVMKFDKVPYDVRQIIYRQLRLLGWIAWRKNARRLAKRLAEQEQERKGEHEAR